MKKKKIIWILAVFFIAILGLGLYLLWIGNQKTYTAEDFGIETIHSQNDADQDGMDDYTDILYGAKAEAKRKPTYQSAYYSTRIKIFLRTQEGDYLTIW